MLQELVDGATGEGAPALGHKEPGQLTLALSQVSPEKSQLVTGYRVHPVDPVLGSLHEYRGLIEVQLLKLDMAELRHAQAVAVEHQNNQLIASRVPGLSCCLAQGLDLTGRDPVFDLVHATFYKI